MSGVFENKGRHISINVCLFYFCVLFILLCSVFVFNFVFTLFHYLHSFVSYFCTSTFQPFIFCVLFYLYDLRFFPVLFFSYLSTSLILPSSLPTLLSLFLPFFLLRNRPSPDRLTYFLVIFCFWFCIYFPLVSNLPLHRIHFTPFFTSLFYINICFYKKIHLF